MKKKVGRPGEQLYINTAELNHPSQKPEEEACGCCGYQKCGPVMEHDSRQPYSCHPQCQGTRSTKLDMITYKRVMLPALQPLNLRCTLHRIKVNTEPLFSASEVGRCENTT